MTRAGRIEERLADRLDKYIRGVAKESLPGGLRVWLVMDLIAQNRYALIGSSLKGSCGTTELRRVRHLQRKASGVTSDGKYCQKPLRGRVRLMRLFPFCPSPLELDPWCKYSRSRLNGVTCCRFGGMTSSCVTSGRWKIVLEQFSRKL